MFPLVRKIFRFAWVLMLMALGIGVPAWADWQSDWEQTKHAAAKEAELVIYGRHSPFFKSVFESFQKSYPAIRLAFEPGRGRDHLKRVSAERRAGLHKVDLMMGGANSLGGFAAGMLIRCQVRSFFRKSLENQHAVTGSHCSVSG